MKNKIGLFILMIVLAMSTAAAYSWSCSDRGERLSMTTLNTCSSSCCYVCVDDSGYSTLQSRCPMEISCQCDGTISEKPWIKSITNTTNTNTTNATNNTGTGPMVPPGWDYAEVLARLEALETESATCEATNQEQDIKITNLQTLVSNLQVIINNILNTLNSGGGTPAGCAYNNPACSNGLVCQNNVCVSPQQQGCQYNNPACGAGFQCVQNQCVSDKQVIFRTSVDNGKYQKYGAEMALDYDNDGDLECFKYDSYYSSYSTRFPVVLVKTMNGLEVQKYTSGKVIVRDFQTNPIYALQESCTIPLANYPQSGYETREVYKN